MNESPESNPAEESPMDWNDHAAYWDEFESARDYARQAFQLLIDRVDLEGLRILDFGCGTGLLTDLMAPQAREIVGLDYAEKMIDVLARKNHPNVMPLVGELSPETISQYAALHQPFDLVVASSVCAFLPNYEAVVGLLHSLLKPNGIFVQWDWQATEAAPNFGFTPETIRQVHEQNGFQVESVGVVFKMTSEMGEMEVLMGVGNKAN